MKYLLFIFAIFFATNSLADYKIKFSNGNIKIPQKNEQLKFVKISAGDYHNNTLKSDGTIISWGSDNFSTTPQDGYFIDIDSMPYKGIALKDNGEIISWNNSVSPSGSDYIDISGGFNS